MKRILSLLLLVAALATLSTPASAQNKRQRMTREQFAETQAQYIADNLALDDATAQKFIETYCDSQKEIWALGPRPGRQRGTATDEQTEQALKERFDHSQKILDIRRKYYGRYSKFLSQKQIQRVYELEKQMMKRLSGKGKQRRPQR